MDSPARGHGQTAFSVIVTAPQSLHSLLHSLYSLSASFHSSPCPYCIRGGGYLLLEVLSVNTSRIAWLSLRRAVQTLNGCQPAELQLPRGNSLYQPVLSIRNAYRNFIYITFCTESFCIPAQTRPSRLFTSFVVFRASTSKSASEVVSIGHDQANC